MTATAEERGTGRRGARGKTALVTGASGGIGYELARLFARDGYDLVVVARGEEKLAQLARDFGERFGVSVKVVAQDLAEPAAPGEVFAELQREALPIDVLVNNAGYATYGLFWEIDLRTELQMIQVNVAALTHLTKLFLPGMLERGGGKILNLASTAAFQPGPLMAAYYATKAYILSLSEALANELRGTGVTVTALCPGPTRSGFQERAGMEGSRLVRGEIMDARTVALAGYRGLMRNKTVVIPGWGNQLLALAPRLTPRDLVTRFVRRAQERVG